MEAIGAGIAQDKEADALLGLAKKVRGHINALRHNDELKEGLADRVKFLIAAMESVRETCSGDVSPEFVGFIEKDLNDIEKSLKSVSTRQSGSHFCYSVKRFFWASADRDKLRNCQEKLERLTFQVHAFHDAPRVWNNRPEAPSSNEGLDRISPVREFLDGSSSQDLRVVCIYGHRGLGKTTLLDHLWSTYVDSNPALAGAYVQIGENADDPAICLLQASIVRQLGGPNFEFSSSGLGKGELCTCFERLKKEEKPVFLAIDNVFSPKDLETLLPSTPTMSNKSVLPVKSCITLTCRDFKVVRSLLGMCGLQEDNILQVFFYEPPFLSDEVGRRLFLDCAGMALDAPEHEELLGGLVPLCKGLPLAITIVGEIFRDRSRRVNGKWQLVQKEMANVDW